MPTTPDNENPSTTAQMATVERDGGDAKITDEMLVVFKAEADQICRDAAHNVNERRYAAEEIRFVLWEGQSPDGRKHADAQGGQPAFPFEGASDARIRLADMIVNERVLILLAAALRHLPAVKGLDLDRDGLGAKLTILLTWVIKNKLGADYFRELAKLASYQESDSPAVAVLGVTWNQETALEMKTLSLQDIGQILVQAGMAPGDIAGLEAMLHNPDREDESIKYLTLLLPYLKPKRARQVCRDLRENKQAEFPAPYLRVNQPEFAALRLFDDVFFPANTTKFKSTRNLYIREWLAEYELKERIVSMEYDSDWVDEVLKHEGTTGFPLYRRDPTQGDFMLARQEDTNSYRGLFEVITVYFKAVNEDNIPGVYKLTYHHAVDFPAGERELLDYKHGEYPAVCFTREIITAKLWDSRGVPELVATEQNAMKLLADSRNDHVTIATLPNIKVPRRRSKLSLKIGPLIVIREDRPGDVTWMTPPQYPAGNKEEQMEIQRRVDEYWGRISANVQPTLTQLHQTGQVLNFLTNLTDAFTMLLQLCQQFMSDDDLKLITGDDGQAIAHSREDIQGKFSVDLSFDPRDLDLNFLKEIANIIGTVILPMDTVNTVQRDKLVQRLFSAISPTLARETLQPVQAATQSEIADEKNNFTQIAAGIEPPMLPGGLNFPLRLQTLLGIGQQNPESYQKLSPKSKEILQARIKYLQNQVQQLKNAQIGRTVGQPALGQDPGMGAADGGMPNVQ